MAATTSNVNPRRTGFDFAALAASAGRQDSGEEVARLRAALETLAELVIAHGVMDARTLESIVGDLIQAPMAVAPLAAPLPPPAPSASEAAARGIATRAPAPAARPLGATPRPTPVSAPKPVVAAPKPVVAAPKPVVAAPKPVVAAPKPVVQPAPVVEAPKPVVQAQPVVEAPKPVVQAAPVVQPQHVDRPQAVVRPQPVVEAPAPVAAAAPVVVEAPAVVAAEAAPRAEMDLGSDEIVASMPSVAPVVAEPFPTVAAPYIKPSQQVDTRRMPKVDAARLAAELTELPAPAQKPSGFFGRLFGKKASPAAVAASAASVEFTERMPKLPFDLYGEQQKATELSFPPAAVPRRKTPVATPRKRSATPVRPANAGPTRFCDRCWRKLDGTGSCKGCSASA